MIKLFVYGTLRDPVVQQNIFGRVVPGVPDKLRGFRKIWLGIYPAILPDSADSIIDGLLLELTPEELLQGDIYETEDYQRIEVTLESGVVAWVYRANQ